MAQRTAAADANKQKYPEILAEERAETNVAGYWETLEANSADWAHEVSACRLWRAASDAAPNWTKEYRRLHGGDLVRGEWPQFVGKGAVRIREKTYQKIQNASDPRAEVNKLFDEPAPVPRLEDLVRVRINCSLLDGVPFLISRLSSLAKEMGYIAEVEAKGNIRGYFAQHLLFRTPVHFMMNKQQISYNLTCEVQVATALASHVWELSHAFYEESRTTAEEPADWQWAPSDPRFLSRQLGHMIHLADGLFCMLRDSAPAAKE